MWAQWWEPNDVLIKNNHMAKSCRYHKTNRGQIYYALATYSKIDHGLLRNTHVGFRIRYVIFRTYHSCKTTSMCKKKEKEFNLPNHLSASSSTSSCKKSINFGALNSYFESISSSISVNWLLLYYEAVLWHVYLMLLSNEFYPVFSTWLASLPIVSFLKFGGLHATTNQKTLFKNYFFFSKADVYLFIYLRATSRPHHKWAFCVWRTREVYQPRPQHFLSPCLSTTRK